MKNYLLLFLLALGFAGFIYLLFPAFSLSHALGFLLLVFLFFYATFLFALIIPSFCNYLAPVHREKMLWARAIILDFFLQAYILFFLSLFSHKKWQTKGKGTPLLLIHGYLHPSSAWIHLMRMLEKEGFGPIYTLKLGYPFDSIPEYAEKVEEKRKEIAAETKREDLILIGHSMGGLIAAFYSLHLDAKKNIAKVITIGSPLKGTQVAKIGIGECVSEMMLHSSFTKDLTEEILKEKRVQFFHIGSKTDQLIIPYTSAFVLEDPSRTLLLEGVGHIGLLFSRKVAEKIAKDLS